MTMLTARATAETSGFGANSLAFWPVTVVSVYMQPWAYYSTSSRREIKIFHFAWN